MPDNLYLAEVWGGCLGPALPDGTRLWVDPDKPIEPLDLCTIVLRKDGGPWSRFMDAAWREATGNDDAPNCMAKIFLGQGASDGREMYLFGQLSPPCIGVVAADEIEAMHAVVGSAGHGEIDVCNGEAEREAFELIAWCRSKSASRPSARNGGRRR